ncbi:unnamed protein product [Parajaminaea phylloscopi]
MYIFVGPRCPSVWPTHRTVSLSICFRPSRRAFQPRRQLACGDRRDLQGPPSSSVEGNLANIPPRFTARTPAAGQHASHSSPAPPTPCVPSAQARVYRTTSNRHLPSSGPSTHTATQDDGFSSSRFAHRHGSPPSRGPNGRANVRMDFLGMSRSPVGPQQSGRQRDWKTSRYQRSEAASKSQTNDVDIFGTYFNTAGAYAPRIDKGKGRASEHSRFDAFELIAQEAAAEAEALPAGYAALGPETREAESRYKAPGLSSVTQPSPPTLAQSAKPTSSTAQFPDRFDWRQTATQFRQRNVTSVRDEASPSGSRRPLRRPPSPTMIRAADSRPSHLKSRVSEYQDHLTHLAALEREHERAEWEQLRSRSIDELVAEGWAMDGLVGYWQGGSRNTASAQRSYSRKSQPASASQNRTAVLSRVGLQKLDWSRFKPGDKVELRPSESTGEELESYLPREQVILSAVSASSKRRSDRAAVTDTEASSTSAPKSSPSVNLIATILSIDSYRLRVLFAPPHSAVDLEACPSWRLDLAPNGAIDVKIDEAIESLDIDAQGLASRDFEHKWELTGTELIDLILPQASSSREELSHDVANGKDRTQNRLASIFESDLRIRSWYERYLRPNPLIIDGDPDLGLNESQLRAVATMLSCPLSLIQGPPGTGKTHTLVSTLKLLKHHFAVPHPILLSAHTNVAVDNLAEAALAAGLNVVRMSPAGTSSAPSSDSPQGNARSLKSKLRSSNAVDECTLERKMEKHPMYKKLEEIKINMISLRRRLAKIYEEELSLFQKPSLGGNDTSSSPQAESLVSMDEPTERPTANSASTGRKLSPAMAEQLATLRKSLGRYAQQAYIVSRQIHTDILYQADVVCSTLLSSRSAALRCIDFPLVFIDESTQAQEVLSLVPLMKGARQVGLIGDHRQLPPVLRSTEAKNQGGARSLFERLVDEDGWSSDSSAGRGVEVAPGPRTRMQMLQVQHRMHPDLASFPNQQFYNGQLDSAPATQSIAPIRSCLLSEHGKHLLFVDHRGCESVSRSTLGTSAISLQNHDEMVLLCHVLVDILASNKAGGDATISGDQIGIITPYVAQARLISRVLRPVTEADARRPERKAVEKKLVDAGVDAAELEKIEVNTVDGFQGREKDVIVFSAVRCQAPRADPSHEDGAAGSLDTAPQRTFHVGFLADERRLNVALTRAKRACFVLGNLETWLCARAGPSTPGGSSSKGGDKGTALSDFADNVQSRGMVISGSAVRERVDLGFADAVALEDDTAAPDDLWLDGHAAAHVPQSGGFSGDGFADHSYPQTVGFGDHFR